MLTWSAVAAVIGGAIWYETSCGGTAMAQTTEPAAACCAADEKMEDAAIACTITDAAVMKERVAETKRLFSAAHETIETDSGYKFKFDRALAEDLFAYARFESDCCTFIEFTLTFERNNGPLWLELSGSPEAKKVIASMLAS
jgi:hypothetical protein